MKPKPKRFYCPKELMDGPSAVLPRDEALHLTRVLRLGVGAEVSVFDGEGNEYPARVVSMESGGVELELEEPFRSCPEPRIKVIVGLSLFARDRLRFTVQKAVELGASEIRLVKAERSVRGLGLDRSEKLHGLLKVAREAAKQCGRNLIPDIRPAVDLAQFSASLPGDCLKLIFWEKAREPGLREILARAKDRTAVAGLIGPEGGFSVKEVELLKEQGFLVAAAGPRILRSETAALFFMCAIQYELGDMGFPLTSQIE